jgi:hypothetical protein
LDKAVGFDFALSGRVVPMSVAPNPGPWYSRLATYKTFHRGYSSVLASLAYTFLTTHEAEVEHALGGEMDRITVVPSTRGVPPDTQPLRRVLSLIPPLEEHTAALLRHVPGQKVGRQEYQPGAFECVVPVDGQRIILIEDTWVTGAKAVSAAGALLAAGAENVLIMPMGRMVQPKSGYYPEDHPYFEWIDRPYDFQHWPLD